MQQGEEGKQWGRIRKRLQFIVNGLKMVSNKQNQERNNNNELLPPSQHGRKRKSTDRSAKPEEFVADSNKAGAQPMDP